MTAAASASNPPLVMAANILVGDDVGIAVVGDALLGDEVGIAVAGDTVGAKLGLVVSAIYFLR